MSLTKIETIFIVIGLIACAFAGYGVGSIIYQSQISKLESDISEKDTQISNLQSILNMILSNITALNLTLQNVRAQLAQALTNITALEKELADAKAELTPGRLPILHVGNHWTHRIVQNQTPYIWTWNITGEEMVDGRPCYIEEITSEPRYHEFIKMIIWVDKSTMEYMKEIWISENYTFVTVRTFAFDGVLWPKIVGKITKFIRTDYSSVTVGNATYPVDFLVYNCTWVVESIVDITVEAGTFTCFKIDNYIDGQLRVTEWYSDTSKKFVKWIDHKTGDTGELLSYSV